MQVEVVISKRTDPDLMSLYLAGYALSRMIRDVLSSFANGKPMRIVVDEKAVSSPTDNDPKIVRIAAVIDEKDTKTTALLRSVRPRRKSSFCKALLRSSLSVLDLGCFFEEQTYIYSLMERKTASDISISDYNRKNIKKKQLSSRTGPYSSPRKSGKKRVTVPDSVITAEQGTASMQDNDTLNMADVSDEPATEKYKGEEQVSAAQGEQHIIRMPEQEQTAEDISHERENVTAAVLSPDVEAEDIRTDVSSAADNSGTDLSSEHDDSPATSGMSTPGKAEDAYIYTQPVSASQQKDIKNSVTPQIDTPAPEDKSAPAPQDEGIVYIDEDEGGNDSMSEDDLLDAFDKL